MEYMGRQKQLIQEATERGVTLTEAEINLIKSAAMVLGPIEERLGNTVGASALFNEIHSIANYLHLLSYWAEEGNGK